MRAYNGLDEGWGVTEKAMPPSPHLIYLGLGASEWLGHGKSYPKMEERRIVSWSFTGLFPFSDDVSAFDGFNYNEAT